MLKVDWWQDGAANFRVVVCTAINEVAFYCLKKKLVCSLRIILGLKPLRITAEKYKQAVLLKRHFALTLCLDSKTLLVPMIVIISCEA